MEGEELQKVLWIILMSLIGVVVFSIIFKSSIKFTRSYMENSYVGAKRLKQSIQLDREMNKSKGTGNIEKRDFRINPNTKISVEETNKDEAQYGEILRVEDSVKGMSNSKGSLKQINQQRSSVNVGQVKENGYNYDPVDYSGGGQ